MNYRVTRGHDNPTVFERDGLQLREPAPLFIPGITLVGYYATTMGYPVVSFLYCKRDAEGYLEQKERAIIQTGWGRGVHPGHVGQESALYVIGLDIARILRFEKSGKAVVDEWVVEDGETVTPKHFSTDCMWYGILGEEPVPADN